MTSLVRSKEDWLEINNGIKQDLFVPYIKNKRFVCSLEVALSRKKSRRSY